ncbi:MAG: NAD(P)-binding protein [Chloroflexota bacterium]|nr:NAD(P)-binding protein [Chloroflexota bacterium]
MSGQTAVVIGAGLAGLTTASLLVQQGWSVDILEAHVDPGGCAATFRRGGYAFDAGATLFAGFAPQDPHGLVGAALGLTWPVRPLAPDGPAMRVLVEDASDDPGGSGRWEVVDCYGDVDRWRAERRRAFPGAAAERFWQDQEVVAKRLWPLAARVPVWPPTGVRDLWRLAGFGLQTLRQSPALATLAPYWRATVAGRLAAAGVGEECGAGPGSAALGSAAFGSAAFGSAQRDGALYGSGVAASPEGLGDARLRRFCDAQLLITAQTTSASASWLYGAVALDLARHGPVHVAGGAGALAETLLQRYLELGGRIHFRTRAEHVEVNGRGRVVAVRDQRGGRWPAAGKATAVVANLPPANLAELLGESCPTPFRRRVARAPAAWGAFTLYLGVDEELVAGSALHHQVVTGVGPLGEGRSVFVSVSPAWDRGRAPAGQRAVTVSTHTAVEPWWAFYRQRTVVAREDYRKRRAEYAARCLALAARALPGLAERPQGIRMTLPGTPITFARFTRRREGRVGGLPQTSLGAAFPARVLGNLWLVGDYIFPGQSSASTLLGALRVTREITASTETGPGAGERS